MRIFDAAETDVGVAPGDREIDRHERDVEELGRPMQAPHEEIRNFDIESDDGLRMRRVGFDKRRAAFRIAGPAENGWRFGGIRQPRVAPRFSQIVVTSGFSQITGVSGFSRTITDRCRNDCHEQTVSQAAHRDRV